MKCLVLGTILTDHGNYVYIVIFGIGDGVGGGDGCVRSKFFGTCLIGVFT